MVNQKGVGNADKKEGRRTNRLFYFLEQDGAEPSPNAISLKNLIRLGTIMEKSDYVTHAQGTLDWSYRAMAQYPYAMPALVTSSLLMYHGVKQASASYTKI